jgi:omega-3 fatty acid desaturase (delta-15 desaturase)
MSPPSIAVTTTTTEFDENFNTKTLLESEPSQKRSYPTLDELRNAVPKHCFEKNAFRSCLYLIKDYSQLAFMYLLVPYIEQYLGLGGLFAWWWIMGMFGFALFVVGHDCGHTTFSNYSWFNDICGHIAHAPIFVPFWPWAKSHRQHHQHTSHVEKDKGHPWLTEEWWMQQGFVAKYYHKLIPITGFLMWSPGYLIFGVPDGSHFWPGSKLFTTKTERIQCAVSSICCIFSAMVALYVCNFSFIAYTKYYIMPVIFTGFWIAMVTYLHHHEETIETYEEGTWNFVRGQLNTVDRRYGFGLESLLHNITDSHLVHHLFYRQIPHYHIHEATESIKPVIAKYDENLYRCRDSSTYLYEYIMLNLKLDYVKKVGNGVLRFAGIKSNEKNE